MKKVRKSTSKNTTIMSEAIFKNQQKEIAAIFAVAAGRMIAQEGLCTATTCAAPLVCSVLSPWLVGGAFLAGAVGLGYLLCSHEHPELLPTLDRRDLPSTESAQQAECTISADDPAAVKALVEAVLSGKGPHVFHFHLHANIVQQLNFQPQSVLNHTN